jgi:hypothetical protein
LGSFFLGSRGCQESKPGAIWKFKKRTGLLRLGTRVRSTNGPSKGLCASGPKGLKPSNYSALLMYKIS